MNVLRLRVTDDMPMAARVLVWPRDQGGYFIYVRPGTPRGSVRCALRELKDTSAAHRELTVIAFAAKNAWRSPRERVMSFGAGLATTVITSGLATSVAVPEMAVAPVIHHHARSFLPSWADLDPGADRAGKPAPSASRHPSGPPSATPSHVPQSHSGTPGRAGLSSRSAAGRGHVAPGAQKSAAQKSGAAKSGAQKSGAAKWGAQKSGAQKSNAAKWGAQKSGAQKSNAAKSGAPKWGAAEKAAKNAGKNAAKPSKPVLAKLAKACAPKPVKPAQPSKPSDPRPNASRLR